MQFKATEQVRTPRTAYDVRAAWTGPHPRQSEVQLHVEAAAYRGRVVFFDCLESGMIETLREQQARQFRTSAQVKAGNIAYFLVSLAMLLGAAWLTRRNLSLNRGDRTGAFRLAAFVFIRTYAKLQSSKTYRFCPSP